MDIPNKEGLVVVRGRVATYGKLSQNTMLKLKLDGLKELHLQISKIKTDSYEALRNRINKILAKKSCDEVIWPLTETDMEAIKREEPPEGLLLVRYNRSFTWLSHIF